MPHVYFGYPPRARGATKLAVTTPQGELEPMEPSQVKVFTQTVFSPMYSLMMGVLGLLVSIFTYPKSTYYSTHLEGLVIRSKDLSLLPFANPGLAVVIKKGSRLLDSHSSELEKANFTQMSFAGRTVFLKEEPTVEDFQLASGMDHIDPTGPAPSRYLNTDAFEAWLILQTVTTAICSFLRRLTSASSTITPPSADTSIDEPKSQAWIRADRIDEQKPVGTLSPFEFKTPKSIVLSGGEKIIGGMIALVNGLTSTSIRSSGVVMNPDGNQLPSFIRSGKTDELNSNGLIFKFDQRLALPDPNLIGDILGRHFMQCLGDSWRDQVDVLNQLKSGLAHLRLSRVGDEMTHLFKCIEIALQCQAGIVPFFTGRVYEGCVIMGGIGGDVILNGERHRFLDLPQLKDEFLNVSTHAYALRMISRHWREADRAMIERCDSMWKLRGFCLVLSATQDVRDEIIRWAANLDFGIPSWALNPHTIAACSRLISNINSGNLRTPIGRLCLFSRDPVMIALSCFGEKTAPSWDIPNGVHCSFSKNNPPNPLIIDQKRKKQPGVISDAAWVMVVRRTDLVSAVEDFKSMANTMKYRSTSSSIAKKVGHQVYNRERMAEFWIPLRQALKTVNPTAVLEQGVEEIKKGKRDRDTSETIGKEKKRKLGFGVQRSERAVSVIQSIEVGEGDHEMSEGHVDDDNLDEGELQE